jgi:hypothetical protein
VGRCYAVRRCAGCRFAGRRRGAPEDRRPAGCQSLSRRLASSARRGTSFGPAGPGGLHRHQQASSAQYAPGGWWTRNDLSTRAGPSSPGGRHGRDDPGAASYPRAVSHPRAADDHRGQGVPIAWTRRPAPDARPAPDGRRDRDGLRLSCTDAAKRRDGRPRCPSGMRSRYRPPGRGYHRGRRMPSPRRYGARAPDGPANCRVPPSRCAHQLAAPGLPCSRHAMSMSSMNHFCGAPKSGPGHQPGGHHPPVPAHRNGWNCLSGLMTVACSSGCLNCPHPT